MADRFENRFRAAEAAGVVKTSLQRWINGEGDPSFEGLARLAKAADVSIAWLAYGEGADRPNEQPTAPQGDWDPDLMHDVVLAIEELLEELDRVMEPEKKAKLIVRAYESEIAERAQGRTLGAAQIIRLFKAVA